MSCLSRPPSRSRNRKAIRQPSRDPQYRDCNRIKCTQPWSAFLVSYSGLARGAPMSGHGRVRRGKVRTASALNE